MRCPLEKEALENCQPVYNSAWNINREIPSIFPRSISLTGPVARSWSSAFSPQLTLWRSILSEPAI